jgi:aldehyde dehydrogenase (NAD+)
VEIGAALVSHSDVDAVSFTGSTATGRKIAVAAAQLIRPVTLELGGKSANVVLEDADLETAIKVGVANAFMNAGQTCNAWTRLLVPESSKETSFELVSRFASTYTVGDPLDPTTRMGPLVSSTQRDRVVGYIEDAIADGATLLLGGPERPEGLETGYYVRPTVLVDVDPGSRLAQEEVFGPVLAVIAYRSEEEALEIANNSPYGLGGGVWSRDPDHARRFANRMETGQVDINGGAFNVLAPFGGFKASGMGREFGAAGIEEYLRTKSYQF